MRVAAGVLIIIMAVVNLGAGTIYTLGGGFIASTSAAMGTDPGTADMQVTQAFGGILLLAGIGLFVLCGLEIATGVLLFLRQTQLPSAPQPIDARTSSGVR